MNMRNSMPMPLFPGEPTGSYLSSGASAGEPAGRVKVAVVPESVPTTNAIRALLWKRLVIVAIVFLLAAALTAITSLMAPSFLGGVFFFTLLGQALVLSAVILVWIVHARQSLSLRALRGIELLLFGDVMLSMVLITLWDGQEALTWCAQTGGIGMSHGARYAGLPWFAQIVMYGVCIPNTWRRCAAVVGVSALLPLALHAALGLADPALDRHLLLVFLLELALWMVIGVAIAVFGSHHIAVLRRQAFEAHKLGQYVLKKRLGSGGMGDVHLAEHPLLRRPCAIKLIRPERALDSNILDRFEREVQATAKLTHPNVVQIYDYGHAEDDTFYYVMEYLPGLNLEQLVNRHGPVPPERAVHLLRQVCGALRAAHAIGLIHRDIKPSNILIGERGGSHDVVKLVDFGLVLEQGVGRNGASLTQESAIAGTPTYMSPEQARAQEDLDHRSDIYSVGAVAYFLLTGEPPFAARSPVKMLTAHIYERPAPLTDHRPDVSADLQVVVLRCLAKDPADRFADAESLGLALAGCQSAGQWSEKQAADWWRSSEDVTETVTSDMRMTRPE